METMILYADSGSTKTEWMGHNGQTEVFRHTTPGINPFLMSSEQIGQMLLAEPELMRAAAHAHDIRFYGAGCRGTACNTVRTALERVFKQALHIVVDSDLAGAAMALFGGGDGIACILGTGSNSGLFVAGKLVAQVSPLGYILGDEGSGAVLGRRLVGDVLKRQMPDALCQEFLGTYPLSADEFVQRVYREPMPNRFLASFAPFLHKHRQEEAVRRLLLEEFERFFKRNVAAYQRPDLPVGLVGSIAFYFKEEVAEAAARCGLTVDKVMKGVFNL
ncbi:MAG: ATPase [Alloprevotella sp.]